jgi:triosephosphate isomerase
MEEIIGGQVRLGLAGLSADDVAGLVVAYEPIWAIGTGKTATTEQANDTCAFVRHTIRGEFGDAAAEAVRVLYGGSVKPSNIASLMAASDVDGALVGGACLEPESFAGIIRFKP